MSLKTTPRHVKGSVAPKYTYHDEPHSFEATVDYVVVNTSASETQDVNDNNLNTSIPSKDTGSTSIMEDDNDNEIMYSNISSHFKFEVLETTV